MNDRRMPPDVAAFTDTYHPTVNGVTYTVDAWRQRWADRGGRMSVVYPGSDEHAPSPDEYPARSLPFPFYEGFRVAIPRIPDPVKSAEVVHAHTPFALGLAARRLANRRDVPLVASYHTPTAEYADYLARGPLASGVEICARRYERWYLRRADAVVVPSDPARTHLQEMGVDAAIEVVPNGIDTDTFEPVSGAEATDFRERYDLPTENPLVGYTGRHGFEKNLTAIPPALARADLDPEPTLVVGGDGPARDAFERSADEHGIDARFLGFLPREDLPAFYTALDAFLFPSPVETQGLVALEAKACGTPVVGVDAGALAETVDDGVTGYHFAPDSVAAFAAAIERTIADREALRLQCLDRRDRYSLDHAIDVLAACYDRLLDA
jgi:glycosyltransferase involved in cell wall biosynthesis